MKMLTVLFAALLSGRVGRASSTVGTPMTHLRLGVGRLVALLAYWLTETVCEPARCHFLCKDIGVAFRHLLFRFEIHPAAGT